MSATDRKVVTVVAIPAEFKGFVVTETTVGVSVAAAQVLTLDSKQPNEPVSMGGILIIEKRVTLFDKRDLQRELERRKTR